MSDIDALKKSEETIMKEKALLEKERQDLGQDNKIESNEKNRLDTLLKKSDALIAKSKEMEAKITEWQKKHPGNKLLDEAKSDLNRASIGLFALKTWADKINPSLLKQGVTTFMSVFTVATATASKVSKEAKEFGKNAGEVWQEAKKIPGEMADSEVMKLYKGKK